MKTLSKDVYKDRPKAVREYMENVIECLESDYGNIPSSWRISLDLIADNVETYLEAVADVRKNGIVLFNKHNNVEYKNPACTIMNQAQSQLRDLLKTFALTPMTRSKMKVLENVDAETIKTNYIDSLTD